VHGSSDQIWTERATIWCRRPFNRLGNARQGEENMFILFTAWNYPVTILELSAVITSLVGVWLGTTGARFTWPWWVTGSTLYGFLFLQYDLIASAALQLVFVAGGIWGWFGWGKSGAKPESLKNKERVIWLLALVVSWILLAPALASIGAAGTWLDSFILLGSLIAQILMVREKFEAWPIWFVVNIVATIHYARQGLWFTSLLYVVFTIVALVGWRKWQIKAKN
jgi:nicotinamide mononucleotide transporter